MAQTGSPHSTVQEALRDFQEHRRLVTILRTMALELERVSEDNTQLRAAIKMYREVLKRKGGLRRVSRAKVARSAKVC